MASAPKTHVVEDSDESAKSGIPPEVFPSKLAGPIDALDAARYRSAVGMPKVLAIAEGEPRLVIRRFEGGRETWSASTAEMYAERGNRTR